MNFKKEIVEILKDHLKIDESMVAEPPSQEMGDLGIACFPFAKEMKKAPNQISEELCKKVALRLPFSEVKCVGPYLNFVIDKKILVETTLMHIFEKKEDYGKGEKKKDKVMVEYSQANTHKAFHVGHLRGTSIGESLSRILKHSGFDVLQANYQGDTGAHVAKWLWCYLKFHKGENPPKEGMGKWIAGIYVESVKKIDENPDFQAEVNEINLKLENKEDPDLMRLWKESRQWSLDGLDDIYKDLDAHFDKFFFEGEEEKEGKKIVQDMLKKGIAKESDGASIIDLERYKLGVWVLLRKDGTVLYSAKDIALAHKKFREFNIDRSIYVIGNAQSLHMKQLFKTLEILGYKEFKKCFHLSYDEVRLPTGKMSSRTGENILYSDMREEIFRYTEEETRKRHEDWSKEKVAKTVKAIAIAALKFDMITHDPNKPIIFDTKKACDFEGETGPYVQYSHARCCSILKKYGKGPEGEADFRLIKEPEEILLIKTLGKFPLVIDSVVAHYSPYLLGRYVLELSQIFNNFYHSHQVVSEDENLTKARALMVDCVRQVLKNSLYLLGMEAPEEM